MTNQLFSNIISGISVAILLGIVRLMLGVRKDFRRFMSEHAWLLRKMREVLAHTNLPENGLPWKDRYK